MFTFNKKDYQIAEQVQTEMRAQADQSRLLQTAPDELNEMEMGWVSRIRSTGMVKGVVIVVTLLVLLFAGQQAFAQQPHPAQLSRDEDGGGEPIKAYREGRYYLRHGEYELAMAKLTEAIGGLPEIVFQVPGYADWYWFLGEAQEGAGLYAEALVSYQKFLDLVGDQAAPWTFEKVEALAMQVNVMLMADMLS